MKSPEEILQRVADFKHVHVDEIKSRSHKADISHARFIYWYLLKNEGYRISKIAKLADRSHATVLHGIGVIAEISLFNEQLRSEIAALKSWIHDTLVTAKSQFYIAERQPAPFEYQGRKYEAGDYLIHSEPRVAITQDAFKHLFEKVK